LTINGRTYEARRDVYRLIGGQWTYRSSETYVYDCDTPSDAADMPEITWGTVCGIDFPTRAYLYKPSLSKNRHYHKRHHKRHHRKKKITY
jgi:hypothetical protein